jgi:hypothetical protein
MSIEEWDEFAEGLDQKVTVEPNESAPLEETRHLTERELASDFIFNMKMYWQPGYCWQEEWDERFWCMECSGSKCNENDFLEIQKCDRNSRQQFNWIPTNGGGRLKVANSNLCYERTDTNTFRLKTCSTSSRQVLVGFNANRPFELYPRGFEDEKCLTNRHHPKPSEVIHTEWCRLPRSSDTSKWQVYWPSGSSGGSSGSSSQSTGSSSSVQLRLGSCSASSPCDECEGDCDRDSHCKGNLVCFQRGGNVRVPGCEGNDASKSDYCVDPQNL